MLLLNLLKLSFLLRQGKHKSFCLKVWLKRNCIKFKKFLPLLKCQVKALGYVFPDLCNKPVSMFSTFSNSKVPSSVAFVGINKSCNQTTLSVSVFLVDVNLLH